MLVFGLGLESDFDLMFKQCTVVFAGTPLMLSSLMMTTTTIHHYLQISFYCWRLSFTPPKWMNVWMNVWIN